MALSITSRHPWLILKAKDQGSKTERSFLYGNIIRATLRCASISATRGIWHVPKCTKLPHCRAHSWVHEVCASQELASRQEGSVPTGTRNLGSGEPAGQHRKDAHRCYKEKLQQGLSMGLSMCPSLGMSAAVGPRATSKSPTPCHPPGCREHPETWSCRSRRKAKSPADAQCWAPAAPSFPDARYNS